MATTTTTTTTRRREPTAREITRLPLFTYGDTLGDLFDDELCDVVGSTLVALHAADDDPAKLREALAKIGEAMEKAEAVMREYRQLVTDARQVERAIRALLAKAPATTEEA